MPPSSHVENRLRQGGLRVTAPRRAVLEFLSASREHPTAEEVGRAVNRRAPRASRASVYNVLRSLKSAGLVRELVAGGAVARYDANLSSHDHFVCRACGAVADLPASGPPPALAPDAFPGARVEEASVTFHGTCPFCVSASIPRPGGAPRE